MPLKVAFQTLGCKVNYFESEALKGKFRQEGFEIVNFAEEADAYVLNTCTVTNMAASKSRQMIRRAKRRNPDAIVAVIGCYPQVEPETVSSLPEVDLALGTENRLQLPGLIKKKISGQDIPSRINPYGKQALFEEIPWIPEQGRTRAFLKIQDGCNQFCSYCIIPFSRGPLRSLPPEKGLAYFHEIKNHGYKEVVLTGIHLGLYGIDLTPATNLATFLLQAVSISGIERIRLSSLEPSDFDDRLLAVIKEHKIICRHLHIPLQSGDDTILKRMGRPYNLAFYAGLLEKLHHQIPDLAVSTDIIVGFPGEEEEHFQNSYNFIKESAFSRLHVFKYSPRRGTKAFEMESQVPFQTKEERSRKMIALGEELSQNFQEKFVGRILPVLLEKEIDPNCLEGLTSNYLRVRLSGPASWKGSMKEARIEKNCKSYLQATSQSPRPLGW